MTIRDLSDLREVRKKGLAKILPGKPRIGVGHASCGIAAGAESVLDVVKREAADRRLDAYVTKVGCIGYCSKEPLVNVTMPGTPMVIFHGVGEPAAREIVAGLVHGEIRGGQALCRIEEWDHLVDGTTIAYGRGLVEAPPYSSVPFWASQTKVVLRNAGLINPEDIEEYIAVGGYSSLFKALLKMSPDEVIAEVVKSGLRGRGGAGFPTGRKWRLAREASGSTKYVVCNGDEGDPGAYMNRNEMESDPHMLIEGMIIGGYGIGASEGVIFVRAEYPLAIKRLSHALEQARQYGLLGTDIAGSGFAFDIDIVRGAGAFVCGEETALIASVEGATGRPRPRPPFPAEKGLWGQPTNINNVETWSNVPVVISKGAEWFAGIGAVGNAGTKVLSLVGKIRDAGLVEIPLGTRLETIVYDIGGGGLEGKSLKAVQTGGPSGGCIPAALFDSTVDYESLTKVGSIMGSGGMVVMDEDTCMVDTARFFTEFTSDESCGKCAPCREGTRRMLEILTDITEGRGTPESRAVLEELGGMVKKCSLCGHGQTAPNPVLTTLRYFDDEYSAHIERRNCPARVCKELISYYIDPAKCQACLICLRNCPVDAIDGGKGRIHVIDQGKCTKCDTCFEVCPPRFSAVTKISGEPVPPPPPEEERAVTRNK